MQKLIDIKRLVKPAVLRLKAYSAKEIPCRIKLDANESPYDLGLDVRMLGKIRTNRYPDPEGRELKKILSGKFGSGYENILLGNGSDELIYYLITAFGGPVLYPTPTFSMYGIIAEALGEEAIAVSLDKEFDLNTERILDAVKRKRPKLIFLSSPNNPTGNCFSSERILRIIEASKGIVVVDEAYQPFSSEKGFLPLLKDYKNLAIMRTLSKIGLAGLRLGFMIADSSIIGEVNKVRLPFNVNSISQAIAVSVLKTKKRMDSSIRMIIAERERLFEELEKIERIRPFPSEANFILFKVDSADRVYKSLLERGILLRNMQNVVDGCLRVTIGTPKENDSFLNALRKII